MVIALDCGARDHEFETSCITAVCLYSFCLITSLLARDYKAFSRECREEERRGREDVWKKERARVCPSARREILDVSIVEMGWRQTSNLKSVRERATGYKKGWIEKYPERHGENIAQTAMASNSEHRIQTSRLQ